MVCPKESTVLLVAVVEMAKLWVPKSKLVPSSLRMRCEAVALRFKQMAKVEGRQTTTSGDGMECHGPNFFTSISATNRNMQV